MSITMTTVSEEQLLRQARTGDQESISELFNREHGRLRLMVRARLNPALRRRVDEEDVLQNAFLYASERLDDYFASPRAPLFLWLRKIVHHAILKAHREHLRYQVRDVRREVTACQAGLSGESTLLLVDHLVGSLTSPSRAVIKHERRHMLECGLARLGDSDREILCLRHFEQLSNAEAASELGIDASAASKRHVRALIRIEKILNELGLTSDN